MKNLYIIAGCNGAGKTTSSFTILPDILGCKEFVNADEIARGLSPFQPEKVSIQAGKLMLERINNLLEQGGDFAIETTLATKNYIRFIDKAKLNGYNVVLLFLWLNSDELAINRVKVRVAEGGHHIEENVIKRRYLNGIKNFFELYMPIVDEWIFADNSGEQYKLIAEGSNSKKKVWDENIWKTIRGGSNG